MIGGFFFFKPRIMMEITYQFYPSFYFPVKIRNTTDRGINENKHNDAVR